MNIGGFPIQNQDPWINNLSNSMMRIKSGLLSIVAIYQDGQRWVNNRLISLFMTRTNSSTFSGSHAVDALICLYSFHPSFVYM